jgi:hypothetical protein
MFEIILNNYKSFLISNSLFLAYVIGNVNNIIEKSYQIRYVILTLNKKNKVFNN